MSLKDYIPAQNRGLRIEGLLIFEIGMDGRCGVDLPAPSSAPDCLDGLRRDAPVGLPGLSEPQVVLHFTRLNQNNSAIDAGIFPLGSCAMKHSPRLNEVLARLPGCTQFHPLQPLSTVQGALGLMDVLARWLKTLCGMPAITLAPAAGAHGELCGNMVSRAALNARGDARKVVLVPASTHGTNPATAAMCGYGVNSIPSNRAAEWIWRPSSRGWATTLPPLC